MQEINLLEEINASPSKVFPYLTEQELIAKWLTPAVIAYPGKGTFAAFALGDDVNFKVEIIEFVENKELRWKCIDGNVDWNDTEISFRLIEKEKNITTLHFTHTSLTNIASFDKWLNNWQFYLSTLGEVVQ